jgi:dipeptidyl-peptidase-4
MLPLLLAAALAAPAAAAHPTSPTPTPTPAPPAPAPAAAAHESFLARYTATRGFRAGLPARPALTPDGRAALFLRSGPRSAVQALYETDLASGATRELATAEALLEGAAASLSAAEQAQLERQRIAARGITGFELSRDGARVVVPLGGKLFLVDRAGGAVTALETRGRPTSPRLSPDGRAVAYVMDHDLHVLDVGSGDARAVTAGGTADVHRGSAEFVAEEEFYRRDGFWWSPDSRLLAFQETDEREVETFTIHDPLHPERAADTFRYPRAGRANARVRVGVVPAAGGEITWISWDRERWPYLAVAAWEPNAPLSLVVLDRRQRELVLLAADPATGETRVLAREEDPAWVNVAAGLPRWRDDGKGFFWHTERNGAPEIELRRADGTLERTWVRPGAGFARLVGWDERRRALWFLGGPDPAQRRLYRVVDAGEPREWRASGEPVALSATLARSGEVVLVQRTSFSAIEPPAAFRRDGTALARLPSVAEPLPFPVRGELRRLGEAGLRALLVRPAAGGAGTGLPVLLDVYGGPGANAASVTADPLVQWIADQGFLVLSIDGRGTPRRGRAFERAIQGDFAGPMLEDQIAGLQALAREVPEADLSRVAVFGWSFGGYAAALAVLRRPDVFHVAVAGAPVADWADYDTAYTERYLGHPAEAPDAYRRSSLLPLAGDLRRPLLVVHGTADDNVYFFHALKLADAILRGGRRPELLVLPGLTHQALRAGEPLVVERVWGAIVDFLRAGVAAPARGAAP